MANNNLTFSIGSVFKGEGFKQLRDSVKTSNQSLKQGMEVSSKLSGALGAMDGAASKTMVAMTGMLEAVMSFNVTAIASQVAITAINLYLGKMKEEADNAKKRMDELKASVEKTFSSTLSDRMSSVNNEVKSISSQFERITKQANDFTAALEGVRQSEASGGILSLQVEKLNALLDAHSEEQRQNIEAAYALKIAVQKSADTEVAWNQKTEAAHQAVVDSQNRVANIDKQLAVIGEERRSLEQQVSDMKASNIEKWRDVQSKVNELLAKESELEQKKIDVEAEIDVLRVKEKQVKQDATNAQTQATIEIRNAELAEAKLTEAKESRRRKEEQAKDKTELETAVKKRETDVLKEAADIQKQQNDATRALIEAEKAYNAKLTEYYKSDVFVNSMRDMVQGKSGLQGGMLPVDVQKSVINTVVDKQVDDAIRNGVVTTVKDANALQRKAQREARDEITKQQRQQLAEAQKFKRLQEMNPKALCSADRDYMDKYTKIIESAKERKQQLEDAKKTLDNARKDDAQRTKDLSDIRKKLESLGLK